MPIHGKTEPGHFQPLYFKSLQELDAITTQHVGAHYDGILKYTPRTPSSNDAIGHGKLLICHDYKGGYGESAFSQSWSFNFWSLCETFIYFAHHRVSTPPPGWTNAAHRQGVKMLGTIIFEGGSDADGLRLLVGKLPTNARTGQVDTNSPPTTLPVSPFYAKLLAKLAKDRGFDGYLLNFESALPGGVEQSRAVAAWATILQSELIKEVGPHAETVWFDSILINGQLRWQSQLNGYNLPYFLSTQKFFTNYWWATSHPIAIASYFLSLDGKLVGNTSDSQDHFKDKTIQDIYMGIDVWGRGTHGGGGLGCYRALEHIEPSSLGLSTAIFGPGWTWEAEQDKPGFTWDYWFDLDTKLWVGAANGVVVAPEAPPREGEPPCPHGPFKPISAFFPSDSPPDPVDLAFHTTFCPGTGLSWFVEGKKVYTSPDGAGWTDIDKQTTLGNLAWPKPAVKWTDDRRDTTPVVKTELSLDDAWNGGSALKFSVDTKGSPTNIAGPRSIFIPIQSIKLSVGRKYEIAAMYKAPSIAGLGFQLSLQSRSAQGGVLDYKSVDTSPKTPPLGGGWRRQSAEVVIVSDPSALPSDVAACSLGIIVTIENTDPKDLDFSFLVGQLNVYPAHLPEYSEASPLVLWADYAPKQFSQIRSSTTAVKHAGGHLTWEVATNFPQVRTFPVKSPGDTAVAWNPQPTIDWFPRFLYFNIWAQKFAPDGANIGKVDQAVWVGTSGMDGQLLGFNLLKSNLPFETKAQDKVRIYVQGVDEKGAVLPWDKCAFVDAIV